MSSVALQQGGFPQAPKLRLLPKEGSSERRGDRPCPALRLLGGRTSAEPPVLLAGGDAAARAEVVRDLTRTMPASTTFEQASAVWEVLVRAPDSSMVILNGELEDIPARALMQMLAHRHPEVPVVCLDAPAQAAL
jgi:hypothetical protein